MHGAISTVMKIAQDFAWRPALCIALATASAGALAYQNASPIVRVVQALPELPAPSDTVPGYFDMDADSAEFGYVSRFNKWSARLDRYLDLEANLEVDYGMLLTSKLGAGARFTRRNAFSEVLVNGVLAPQKNVRLRFTGAQLRNAGAFSLAGSSDDSLVVQNSYLFNVRKVWHKYLFLSDLGLTAYSTQTSMPSMIPDDPMDIDPESATHGRKDGYILNLGLRPTPMSRLEMRREFSHLSYHLGDDTRGAAERIANRVRYSHYLDNCVRLQGGFSAEDDGGRLDLNIARNNWSVTLSREQLGDIESTAIRVGYSLPLGTYPSRTGKCKGRPDHLPTFEPIVDTSLARPAQLPREPILVEMP
ncbi:MAG TPA: hypothetical protein VGE12_17630 [Noviherbaspirillum sp.]